MSTSDRVAQFRACAQKLFPGKSLLTRAEILAVREKFNLPRQPWLTKNAAARTSRGVYDLNVSTLTIEAKAPRAKTTKSQRQQANVKATPPPPVAASKIPVVHTSPVVDQSLQNVADEIRETAESAANTEIARALSFIPEMLETFVPFGCYEDVARIIASRRFMPIYITGLSGNGKTLSPEQVCALQGRECFTIPITPETDEDDLLGGFRLINGQTVWQDGPVIMAMERAGVAILDEVDLGTSKLMCLQPVLSGKPIYLKKINRIVYPKAGFNVIATANTKGKGSDSGRFIGTNVMNEAFLDRFPVTLYQEYPEPRIEMQILNKVLHTFGIESRDFTKTLVSWADTIRGAFKSEEVDEVISTRRLVNICELYGVYQNRAKALKMALERFDPAVQNQFMSFYEKMDASIGAIDGEKPIEEIASTESAEENS